MLYPIIALDSILKGDRENICYSLLLLSLDSCMCDNYMGSNIEKNPWMYEPIPKINNLLVKNVKKLPDTSS